MPTDILQWRSDCLPCFSKNFKLLFTNLLQIVLSNVCAVFELRCVLQVGPLADEDRIPGIDLALKDGDVFQVRVL